MSFMNNSNLEKILSKDQIRKEIGISVSERLVDFDSNLHWHNFIELELILSGSGEQILNGQKMALTSGCLSVLRLTDFHQVVPTEDLHLLNLMVDDSFLSEELLGKITAGDTLFFNLEENEADNLEKLFRLCMAENQAFSPDIRYLKHLVICIFLKILKMTPKTSGKPPADERPIQAALLYIHMHFRENPKLSEVAKIAHYNASHFSNTFHKELGTTYCDYLNTLKISYAKELLISTSLKIADICYECGFTSHSNFLRLFKEKLGLSPMQFRKRAVVKSNHQVV
ncbi:MAG: AraC family transcriptional regulator [Ruminococcaceae bacterium]|nr:AraC family transcriptional regulator [Oscillospiraceae bacterium]